MVIYKKKVSTSNLRVTDSFLNRKPAKALDLDNPNMHFTLLFEMDTPNAII
jgi:hypothetical protein